MMPDQLHRGNRHYRMALRLRYRFEANRRGRWSETYLPIDRVSLEKCKAKSYSDNRLG